MFLKLWNCEISLKMKRNTLNHLYMLWINAEKINRLYDSTFTFSCLSLCSTKQIKLSLFAKRNSHYSTTLNNLPTQHSAQHSHLFTMSHPIWFNLLIFTHTSKQNNQTNAHISDKAHRTSLYSNEDAKGSVVRNRPSHCSWWVMCSVNVFFRRRANSSQ